MRPQGIDLDTPAEVEVASGAYRRRMARYREQMDPGEREQFADTLTVDPDADSTVVVDGRSADLAVAANARRRQLSAYPGAVPTQSTTSPTTAPRARLSAPETKQETNQETEQKARQQVTQDKPSRRQRRKAAAENRREHRSFGRGRRRGGAPEGEGGQYDGLAIPEAPAAGSPRRRAALLT